MTAYTVLANKYRPRRFEDVVGQEDLARVLSRAVAQGRAAHAYLFCGPRGVGKTSMARIMAKAFNCLENADGIPCGTCRVCRAIDEQGSVLDVVEIDGASHNRVENVRELIENLRFRPVEARHRIYIIDEVHMLSTAAFNALLKTLEEPPDHAKFVLATTEPLKVPETIRSRCQQFDFRRLSAGQITDRLAFICEQEGATVPDGLLPRVARHARGGMRDALSLLDQLLTFGDGAPTVEDFERLTGRLGPDLLHGLVAAALAGEVGPVMAGIERAFAQGARAADVVDQLGEVLEGLLVAAAGGVPTDRTDEECEQLADLASRTNVDHVMAMLDVLMEAGARLKQRHDGRLVVEMAALTIARLPALQSLDEFLAGGGTNAGATAPSRPRAPSAASPMAAAPPPRSTPSEARAPRRAPPRSDPPPSGAPQAAAAQAAPAPAPAPAPRAAAPAPSPAPSPAPEPAAPATPEAFSDKLVAAVARVARSVSVELRRYAIRLDGERVVLEAPADGPSPVLDPSQPNHRAKLAKIASEVAGRPVRIDVVASAGGAGRPAADAPPDDAGVDERVRRRFPGAERLEP